MDIKILRILQQDCTRPVADIGKEAGLSEEAVLDALAEVAGQDPTAAWGATAEELLVNPTAAVGQVISRFRACADDTEAANVVACELRPP